MNTTFSDFLLNENRAYLGQRVGDILAATQDITQNAQHIGTRQLVKNAEGVVNQIRRILHTNWPKEEEKNLEQLQKIGVAVAKSIEDKDDLPGIMAGAQAELEQLTDKLGAPLNKLGSPEGVEEPDDNTGQDALGPPQGEEEPPETPQEPPQQPQMPPGQAGMPPQMPPQGQPVMPPGGQMAPPFQQGTPGGI